VCGCNSSRKVVVIVRVCGLGRFYRRKEPKKVVVTVRASGCNSSLFEGKRG